MSSGAQAHGTGLTERLRNSVVVAAYHSWVVLAPVHVAVSMLVLVALVISEGVRQASWALMWTVGVTVSHGLHLYITRIYAQKAGNAQDSRLTGVRLFSLLVGLIWAALPLTAFPRVDAAGQFFVSMAVLVVAAPTAVLVVADHRAMLAYLLPSMCALIAAWVLWGLQMRYACAGLVGAALFIYLLLTQHRYRDLAARNKMMIDKAWLAEQLRQKNELLESSNQSKTRVLAVASHDLRQPVHALGLLVERLRADSASAMCREQVEVISSVLRTLSYSLETLLDIARLEAGTVAPKIVAMDVGELLAGIQAEFESTAHEKGLKLTVSGDDFKVYSDPALLRSIVGNMASNAVRYTQSGGITIAAEYVENDPPFVCISISDTGPGIPAHQLENIFEDYVRLDENLDRERGLGLGLAIVKRTAQLLNHQVMVESTVGVGSTFAVYVEAKEGAAQEFPDPVEAEPFTLMGRRGVVIDNDRHVLHSMQAMLSAAGCETIAATDCDDLEQKLQSLKRGIDFIVADYHLGTYRTGLDAIKMVRAQQLRDVPSVILTGDVEIRVEENTGLPNLEVLHKPVSPARLRAALEAALVRYRDIIIVGEGDAHEYEFSTLN